MCVVHTVYGSGAKWNRNQRVRIYQQRFDRVIRAQDVDVYRSAYLKFAAVLKKTNFREYKEKYLLPTICALEVRHLRN